MGGDRLTVLTLMILAVAFPWIVASLVTNLQQIQIVGGESPSSPAQLVEEHNSPIQMGAAQYDVSPAVGNFQLAAIAAFAILSSVLVWKLRRRDGIQDRYVHEDFTTTSPLVLAIALGLIVLIFYGLATLAIRPPSPPSTDIAAIYLDASGFIVPLAVVVIVTCSTLGLFLLFRGYKLQPHPNPPRPKMSEEVQRFALILDQTIYSLRNGMDYRATIIGCYGALCKVLESRGVPNSSSLTPREFEALSLNKLSINSRHLHEATLLFEKARYSDEPVSEEEATKSTQLLERLRSEVAPMAKLADEMVVVGP